MRLRHLLGTVGLLLGTLGCAIITPNPTPVHELAVTVRDLRTQQIILTATGSLRPDTGTFPTTCVTSRERLRCLTSETGAGSLVVSAPGYLDVTRQIASLGVPEQGEVGLRSLDMQLPRLVPTGGAQFQLETGAPFTIKGITHLQLLEKHLAGVDIAPYLDDLIRPDGRCGPNLLRVFGMAQNLFHLDPREHADYYAQLPVFAQLLANHRCAYYVEYVAFADALLLMRDDLPAQLQHWQNVQNAFQHSPNVLVELVNENDAGNPSQGLVNWIDTDRFASPTNGLCASHGSNGSQAEPVRPFWCYATGPHTNDAYEWPRKVGHNAAELSWDTGVPVYANENTRAADRFFNFNWAYDAAAGASLLAAGSTFHCSGCRYSVFLTADEKAMLWSWLDGAESVPPQCQVRGLGTYQHRPDWEETDGGATGERVYTNAQNPDLCKTRIRPLH